MRGERSQGPPKENAGPEAPPPGTPPPHRLASKTSTTDHSGGRRCAKSRPLPERTRERLAACEAVSLHYWSDHPQANHVWAVDDHQHAHVVRIDRKTGTAQHVCRAASSDEAEQCVGATEAVTYTVETAQMNVAV